MTPDPRSSVFMLAPPTRDPIEETDRGARREQLGTLRAELPNVSLLQKTQSSPVTCHATGFYPSAAVLFWRKDGEELHGDVEIGETLPNHDGTFQTTANLKVEVAANMEGQYECVFQVSGVKNDTITKLEKRRILSNARIQEAEKRKLMVAIAVPLVNLALVVVVVVVLVKVYKNRQAVDADCEPTSKSALKSVSEPVSE
ncbi:H-2 class I histocompatibility antigen, alpha chain-like [Phycodurus eques]|uniref:H-2 class I histocompatibility antigen, alpha chain-like n=1 Tax=Phycodurus eques TaxID=693459 RepID=UPI002ACE7D96|nr:H-2 class I histocompatibility antigen, alpha chain-like [Phycodurus eques]